ncbi:hypothetical protein [Planktothricoides raciborskii]|uniref:Uncharacterized protein n=1 Tax=Planktothricoides raciborskii FACHB-1370 TaxID=2949576 RepID=A0ABR8EAJ8_9CYAN|nr:hypothetical protein [Planktothricoides raciborskii]MBD2543879.1 hypothetical protein [Planktothricoides raciborskii FACHB-1370]MBD2582867.1 hypothetical protein [Planktothricoides raciborskii FACHB-1261]
MGGEKETRFLSPQAKKPGFCGEYVGATSAFAPTVEPRKKPGFLVPKQRNRVSVVNM